MSKIIMPKKLLLCFFALGLVFSFNYLVLAWTEPSMPAPQNNVPAPLNVGVGGQLKSGGLIINTGGAPIGLIVDQGNVGIGTNAPAYKLDVNGDVKGTRLCIGADCRNVWPAGGAGGGITSLSQGNGIVFTPSSPITTVGTISADTNFLQRRITGTCAAGSSIRVINSDGTVACETDDTGSGSGSNYWTLNGNSLYPQDVNYNVGIGTVNPGANLTIVNNVAPGFLSTPDNYQIMLYTGASAANSYGLGIKSNYMVFNSNGGYSFDHQANTTRMVIDPSGNVGIGITAPTQRLDVNGKIIMRNETVDADPSNTVVTKGYLNSKTSFSSCVIQNFPTSYIAGRLPTPIVTYTCSSGYAIQGWCEIGNYTVPDSIPELEMLCRGTNSCRARQYAATPCSTCYYYTCHIWCCP